MQAMIHPHMAALYLCFNFPFICQGVSWIIFAKMATAADWQKKKLLEIVNIKIILFKLC